MKDISLSWFCFLGACSRTDLGYEIGWTCIAMDGWKHEGNEIGWTCLAIEMKMDGWKDEGY